MTKSQPSFAKATADTVETIRHSLSHIMAAVVKELYPGVKFGIGPAIENGFYYDFDFAYANKDKDEFKNEFSRISPEDLPKIEEEMRELLKQDIKFIKKEISQAEAEKLFANQPYKLELIEELSSPTNSSPSLTAVSEGEGKEGGGVSIYQTNNFVDLCKGPHITSTKEINITNDNSKNNQTAAKTQNQVKNLKFDKPNPFKKGYKS